MGASNGSNAGGGKSFYTLKENKSEGAANTGNIRFYQSIKQGEKWTLGEGFTQMSGHLNQLEVKGFEYQGKPKFELILKMSDEKSGQGIDVKTSFPTTVSKNILNALSNISNYGVISLEIGKPQEFQGKWYPSIFIKNNSDVCKFAFTKANGNTPPKIEYTKDEEGNEIKKGVLAERTFWIEQVEKINAKLNASPNAETRKPAPINAPVAEKKYPNEPIEGDDSDLPF